MSDALWSFKTPPLEFPRPAFEVWLPLPSLLAVIPLALFGGSAPIPLETAMRISQVVPVLSGAVLSVLAWRLAADVAIERGMPTGRARTLAIGTGLASAFYLPLLLHAALPDSTILFGALVLAAGLLMTRVLADPRGARWLDPRLIAIGLLMGAAALTRNEAVWLALVWAWLAWRRRGETRAVRFRLIVVVAVFALVLFAPWAVRNWAVFGNPLPGQAISNALSVTGFDIFAWNDPPTLSRYLAVGVEELVNMRVVGDHAQPAQRAAAAGHPHVRDRAARDAVAVPGSGAAAGGAREPDHVPRHQPGVPGRDDVGHVPPRRGAVPRAAADQRARGA